VIVMIAEPFRHNFELLSFGKCLQYDSAFTAINFFFWDTFYLALSLLLYVGAKSFAPVSFA
jgi:hypothetical protein